VGLKRGEKSRMDEVRVEVGVKEIVGFRLWNNLLVEIKHSKLLYIKCYAYRQE